MARQRTPDSQRPRPFAGADHLEPVVETGVKAWILRRRKMVAALVAVPVSYVFLKLGLGDVLGAELGREAELAIAALIVAAIVERVPNPKGR